MSGESASGDPIDGQALLLAAATASVAPGRLPALVDRAAEHVAGRRGRYRRRRERALAADGRVVYLVPEGHWRGVGDRIGLAPREADAVARAHAEQLRRLARRADRADEFEHALELREAVVLARDEETDGD